MSIACCLTYRRHGNPATRRHVRHHVTHEGKQHEQQNSTPADKHNANANYSSMLICCRLRTQQAIACHAECMTGRRQHDSDTHDSMLTMSHPTSNTVSELSEQYEGGKHTTCRTTRDQQHENSTKAFSKPAKRKERANRKQAESTRSEYDRQACRQACCMIANSIRKACPAVAAKNSG